MAGTEGRGHHPLPVSAEARHDLIPEQVEREKGHGDDGEKPVRADSPSVDPDGRPYPGGAEEEDDFARDRIAPEDQGQGNIPDHDEG